jgi:predicted metal-binding protein
MAERKGGKMKIKKIGSNKETGFTPFLEGLCDFTIEKGADVSGVVSVDELEFNGGNTAVEDRYESTYWPFVNFSRDPISSILKNYRKAVVFKAGSSNSLPGNRLDTLKKVYEIAGKAEARCFYHGYHLAVSFGAGNCRKIFCREEKDCQSLTRGRGCRYPLIARPSIEACRIDRSKIAERLKWDRDEDESSFMGMVFVD